MPPRGLAGLAANSQPLGATAGSSGIDKAITEMHGAPTELLCPEGGPPWPAMPRLLCATAASSRQMELVKEWLPHCQGTSAQQWHSMQPRRTHWAKQKGSRCIIIICSQHGSYVQQILFRGLITLCWQMPTWWGLAGRAKLGCLLKRRLEHASR